MEKETALLLNLIEEDFGVSYSTNKWAIADEHDSLVVDKNRGLFFWNSKGIKGDVYDYLVLVRGFSRENALSFVKTKIKTKFVNENLIKDLQNSNVIAHEKLVDLFWNAGKKFREYWYKRLLSDSTIDRFKLGYYNGWYTVPFFKDNKFYNFQCRRDEPKKEILYWYKGTHPFLINHEILKYVDTVFIPEGTVDSLFLNQEGFPAVGHNAGSNNFPLSWFKYFIKVKNIYYIADNDEAGFNAAKLVVKALGSERVKIIRFDSPFGDKMDTIEYFRSGKSMSDFKKLIDNAKYIYEGVLNV